MMYLGVPYFVAVAAIVWLLRRRGVVLLCGAMVAISFILSLGSTLYVGGHDTHVPLPFVVLANLPFTEGFLSVRFSLFTVLFGAPIIAIGMEELHDRLTRSPTVDRLPGRSAPVLAWLVPLVMAAVVLLPMLPAHTQPTSPTGESTFFTTPAARAIPPGSVVLAYPYPNAPFIPAGPGGASVYTFAPVNDVLLDQAVAGMPFKLVGGYGWRPTKGTYGSPAPLASRPPDGCDPLRHRLRRRGRRRPDRPPRPCRPDHRPAVVPPALPRGHRRGPASRP